MAAVIDAASDYCYWHEKLVDGIAPDSDAYVRWLRQRRRQRAVLARLRTEIDAAGE